MRQALAGDAPLVDPRRHLSAARDAVVAEASRLLRLLHATPAVTV